jgi:transposase, IS30 family
MGRGPGGIPLVGKRAFYIELMKTGISNSEACRRVGVDRKTGVRWQHGRRAKYQGRTYFYPAIDASIVPKKADSGRYLSQAERVIIADGVRDGVSARTIAKLLPGRAVSTVCREIARNGDTTSGNYQPFDAQSKMLGRRPRPKAHKLADPVINEAVQGLLDKQWSPEQISVSLAKRPEAVLISPESIYRGVFNPLIPLRREKALRTRRVQRRKRRRGEKPQRFTAPMRPLSERSPKAADRTEAGHWEGDLIIGEFNGSAIGTLVERVTRMTMIVHIVGARTAEQLKEAMICRFNELPAHLRLSLTWDQGIEMARHHEFTEETGIPVFFCEPHSPWQRPSNENTNGLLRGYFPKSTDLSVHSPERLREVENELNNRPRKTLGWDTPQQRFDTLKNQAV